MTADGLPAHSTVLFSYSPPPGSRPMAKEQFNLKYKYIQCVGSRPMAYCQLNLLHKYF